ncbi:MAG: mandelate racemase/muconate lactonizing enzyme family protein [Dehalococcoidia bacterium]|nr:mandelate racemase/muconate lactonizing enzyme family protein [Dehalococcoidia bacterium]
MKIKEIRAAAVTLTPPMKTEPRVPAIPGAGHFTSPMARYENEFPNRNWSEPWDRAACVVTADDGTWGVGFAPMSGPVLSIINDHFAPLLEGQSAMSIEKNWDLMRRASSPYGAYGLTSYAISALDNALWDLKGKLLGLPAYELLGGPVKDKIFCYASNTTLTYGTENYIEWFLELGFKAVKLFVRHGPEDGIEGLNKNEELVAGVREQVGPDVEIAVDSWMSLNTEYIVRLVEALKPYRIKWLEDYLLPEDLDSYMKVRQRVPGQTLATGEHWYTIHPFAFAAGQGLVDILQPDISWVGGMTASVRICHIAEAHGVTVIGHGGMNMPYGQHLAYAMPVIPWGERSEGVAPPGVPLEEMVLLPGTPVIKDGYLTPSDAPGFGLEFTKDWLEERSS